MDAMWFALLDKEMPFDWVEVQKLGVRDVEARNRELERDHMKVRWVPVKVVSLDPKYAPKWPWK